MMDPSSRPPRHCYYYSLFFFFFCFYITTTINIIIIIIIFKSLTVQIIAGLGKKSTRQSTTGPLSPGRLNIVASVC